MGKFSDAELFGMTIRESATDGSDFTNPSADYRRLFLGEDGFLHVKDSAGSVTDPYDTGGGAVDWTQDVNVSGTSATGWTAQNGTWSSTGTVLQNTDAGAANKWFRWDTKVAMGFPTIYEAECKVVSGGGLAGMVFGWNGNTQTGGYFVGIADTANKVSAEEHGVTEVWSSSQTITTGTFYKVRVVSGGAGLFSIYLAGTLLGTALIDTAGNGPWDYFGLRCHTAAAEFRNIKVWTMSTGAPA